MKKLNEDQVKEILELYPNTRAQDIADRFGVKVSTIFNHVYAHGVKKDPEWIRQNAREHFHADHPARKYWMQKGHTPSNKGKKIEEFMSPEQARKFTNNSYKKGHIPHTRVPIGTEIFMPRDGYVKVKVGEPNVWELKHRLVWMQHNGPIPDGWNVQFKNGSKEEKIACRIDNLYLISKSEQMKTQNSMYARYPEEVIQNIRALGYLTRTINKSKQHD